MQRSRLFLSAFALTFLSAAASAGTTTYTSSAAFLSQVGAGSYTETFTGLSNVPAAFSSGGFSYSITAPSTTYASGDFVGTNQINEALTITFNGSPVTALGGNFFISDLSDAFQAVSLTVMLSDGTSTTFTPATMADSYRGFTSTVAISTLIIGAPGQSLYASLDNLTVGTAVAVPEPASWALASLGVVSLLAYRRRKAA